MNVPCPNLNVEVTDVGEIRRSRERLLESERQLRISEERMRLAQKAAKIGAWEFEFDTGRPPGNVTRPQATGQGNGTNPGRFIENIDFRIPSNDPTTV